MQALRNTVSYLEGIYGPVPDERTDIDLPIEGALPEDLAGVFAQNSPNPRFAPEGAYHWFDGDGMVHAVHLAGGRASYRNRYVQTDALKASLAAGRTETPGILMPFAPGDPRPDRNTANTDLIWFNGALQALWWLGGEPYALSLPELETLRREDLHGTLACGVAAHPKVDPRTGELVFFDYSAYTRPYLRYGVASAAGQVTHTQDIDLPFPALLHDIAITENHTILMDLPMLWDPERLAQGRRRVLFHRDRPARLGVIPRAGGAVRWFEARGCYSYHTVNAWEWHNDRGEPMITLLACRIEDPIPTLPHAEEPDIPRLTFLRLHPFLHRWELNLTTGAVSEQQLDDVPTEFPRINDGWLGVRSRYAYHPRIARRPTLAFDGLLKYDLERGTQQTIAMPPGHVCSEAVFAARPGATEEDDGWLVAMSNDPSGEHSALIVIDARDFDQGVIARIPLPRRVPFGFHAQWIDAPLFA